MLKSNAQFLKKRIAGALIIALLLGIAMVLPNRHADSRVIYPPASLIQPNDITSSHIRDGAIVNADVSSTAGIAWSKLSATGQIVNADVSSTAAIAYSKLTLTGSIANADVSSTAAIVDTKLATISTAGKVSGAALTSLASIPSGAGLIPSANISDPSPNTTSTWMWPEPVAPHALATTTSGLSANTTMFAFATKINAAISVAKITMHIATVSTAGTFDIGYYSHDGQNKLFDFTSPNVTASGFVSATGTAVTIQPGIYYVALIPNGTASMTFSSWQHADGTTNPFNTITGEPRANGSAGGQTAGTLPATFDPTTLDNDVAGLPHRLDN